MTRPSRSVAGLLGLALLAAGCGTASRQPDGPAAVPPPRLSLATTIAAGDGTWAVVMAGDAAARHDNFWQLLARPAGSGRWRLVTPPGVASNGGLVVAPSGATELTAAFRPSQNLAFTPLAASGDLGRRWSPGVLDADLASTPGALAADPATGHMLALLAAGAVEQSSDRGTTWTRLVTRRAIGRTASGRACRLLALTAVAFTAGGEPLVAGACARPGIVPVFAFSGHRWRPAAAPLAARAGGPVAVLIVTAAGGRAVALLRAGTGRAGTLIAAWSASHGPHGSLAGGWLLSPALALRGRQPQSASAGTGTTLTVILSRRTGFTEASPGGTWQRLPELPARTGSIATGPGRELQAIAPAGSAITIWSSKGPGSPWAETQHLGVPIQYGSSG